jgi:hypothetical protein
VRKTPKWNEFAWAAFLYSAIGGDPDYQNLMNQTNFLNGLRTNPERLQPTEIQQKLIRGFLNRWKCRVENTAKSAIAIRSTFEKTVLCLQVLKGLKIEDADFSQIVRLDNKSIKISQVIEDYYTAVRDIGFRIGSTATSKLLHVLQPKLFIMWDKDILGDYHKNYPQISDSGKGYHAYLDKMKALGAQVSVDFQNATLNPPRRSHQSLANYLSSNIGYNPPKTMAKYLDEYNWVTITNEVKLPPNWHP